MEKFSFLTIFKGNTATTEKEDVRGLYIRYSQKYIERKGSKVKLFQKLRKKGNYFRTLKHTGFGDDC